MADTKKKTARPATTIIFCRPVLHSRSLGTPGQIATRHIRQFGKLRRQMGPSIVANQGGAIFFTGESVKLPATSSILKPPGNYETGRICSLKRRSRPTFVAEGRRPYLQANLAAAGARLGPQEVRIKTRP